MEFQVLADIVSKAVLVKAGTFEKMTKENVQIITAIISGTKINWACVTFKTMTEMLQMKSTGVAVQINKFLQENAFKSTIISNGISVTMLDAENVVDLQP